MAFMLMYNPEGYNSVIRVHPTIADKLHDYINLPEPKTKEVYAHFALNKYDAVAVGLTGNYDDFYTLTDLDTQETSILSPNEEKIKAFCAYINRLTT
jgi:hypothetical protein